MQSRNPQRRTKQRRTKQKKIRPSSFHNTEGAKLERSKEKNRVTRPTRRLCCRNLPSGLIKMEKAGRINLVERVKMMRKVKQMRRAKLTQQRERQAKKK